MPPPVHSEPFRLALVLVAAVVGGVVNSIAGGGTLLTFPALIGLGIPAIMANATSTVALWPGAVASMWGYSDLLTGMRSWVTRLAMPSLVGGLVGAWLLGRPLCECRRRRDLRVQRACELARGGHDGGWRHTGRL